MKTENKLILISFGNHFNTAAYNVGLGRSLAHKIRLFNKGSKNHEGTKAKLRKNRKPRTEKTGS